MKSFLCHLLLGLLFWTLRAIGALIQIACVAISLAGMILVGAGFALMQLIPERWVLVSVRDRRA